MAQTQFQVKIITPEDVFFRGEATSVTAPGQEGYLGILRDHAPLVTPLVTGLLTIKITPSETKTFDIKGGFLEVNNNRVVILVESIAKSEAVS